MGLLDALLDPRFRSDVGRGLLDAGNRGVVGGLLGGPVDLTTNALNAALMGGGYAGHKLGLLSADQMPQPIENPIGGSEWIGQKLQDSGLVSGQRNALAEALAGVALPGAAVKAGPVMYRAEQALAPKAADMARNAIENHMTRTGMMLPAVPLGTATRGQTGAALVDSEVDRLARMRGQGFEPGWWRGGKSVADGPHYTPDKSAAEDFAKRHGAAADVREYAVNPGAQFNIGRTYAPDDLVRMRDVLKNDYGNKYADELLSIPSDFKSGRAPGGHIFQIVDQLSGGNGKDVLKAAGFDTINAGQELIVLNKAGTVRDKNLARFDPKKRFSADPFAAVAGGAVGLGLLNQPFDGE